MPRKIRKGKKRCKGGGKGNLQAGTEGQRREEERGGRRRRRVKEKGKRKSRRAGEGRGKRNGWARVREWEKDKERGAKGGSRRKVGEKVGKVGGAKKRLGEEVGKKEFGIGWTAGGD